MQINRCSDIFIENNNLTVYNNISTSHIDVIQVFDCVNAAIKANNIRYEGNTTVNKSSGILIDATDGDIKIFNNVVHSKELHNLIGVHIEPSTSTILIYNNTLVCDGNPGHLISIDNDNHSAPHNIFKIKNNILYKQGAGTGNNTVSIYFDSTILYQNVNSNQINYNSHYNGNDTTAHIQFGGQQTVTYWTIESQGIYGNQLLNVQDSSYSLLYNSPCKNKGFSFYSILDSDIKGHKRPHWSNKAFDIGAYELPDAHIKIGRPTSTNYTTNVDAMGPVFVRNGTSWELTTHRISRVYPLLQMTTVLTRIKSIGTELTLTGCTRGLQVIQTFLQGLGCTGMNIIMIQQNIFTSIQEMHTTASLIIPIFI